ncbi:MAG: imidazole glycerol phosphate synthase subunit HisH, partial [Sphaerochaetaceae bacterium]
MARSIVVIKYNAGNIRSVLCTLNRLGLDAEVTSDASRIRNASRVIFPGVGEASTAMRHLIASGLDELMASLTQPFLGICLGMQLMCRFSEEHDTKCLGIFDLPVVRFPSSSLKVPHMGWNRLKQIDQAKCGML